MTCGGAGGSGAIAAFNGGKDGRVLADGEDGADAPVTAVEAGFEEVGEGVEEEGGDLVAGGGGQEAVKGHVGGDGVGGGGGLQEMVVGGPKGFALVGSGALGSEAGIFGFDDEAELDELAEAFYFVGDEEVKGVAEGFVEAVDGADAEALADFEEALLLEAFGGLTDDAARDAELGGEVALGGEEGFLGSAGAGEVGEALADFLDEGGWAVDGGEGHGEEKIRWSDQSSYGGCGEGFSVICSGGRGRVG